MTIQSLSFLGNPYISGTNARKQKTRSNKYRANNNEQRKFQTFDLKKDSFELSKKNFDNGLTVIDFNTHEITYIPNTSKKQTPSYKTRALKRKQKRQEELLVKLAMGIASSSLLISAGALGCVLKNDNQTTPQAITSQEIEIHDFTNFLEPPLLDLNEEEIVIDDEPQDLFNGAFDFDINLTFNQRQGLEKFISMWNDPDIRARYKYVADKVGIPAEIVAVNHFRETSGRFAYSQVDGKKLENTNFDTWEESAIYAYKNTDLNLNLINNEDINSWFNFLESYNGYGYRCANINTPYVWAGSEYYTSGKYVSDGTFDRNIVDNQPGCAVMLREIFFGDVLD